MGGEISGSVDEALGLCDRILHNIDFSEDKLRSARNWGFFDLFGGGGLITNFVKHHKIDSATDSMENAVAMIARLKEIIGQLDLPSGWDNGIGGVAVFADFFFDGFFSDAYMQSRIFDNIDKVRELKGKILQVRASLLELKKRGGV